MVGQCKEQNKCMYRLISPPGSIHPQPGIHPDRPIEEKSSRYVTNESNHVAYKKGLIIASWILPPGVIVSKCFMWSEATKPLTFALSHDPNNPCFPKSIFTYHGLHPEWCWLIPILGQYIPPWQQNNPSPCVSQWIFHLTLQNCLVSTACCLDPMPHPYGDSWPHLPTKYQI